MIITINDIEYGGDVLKADDEQLQLILRTEVAYEVLTEKLGKARTVICTETIHGTATEYTGLKPISMTTITSGVYMVTFSTKAGRVDALRGEVDRLNSIVEQLLVAELEEA